MDQLYRSRWRGIVTAISLITLTACADDAFTTGDAAPLGDGEVIEDAPGTPGRLLFFGPHPDDEMYVAPLLGYTCLDLGWYCTIVVATQGEGGSCKLPGGCEPDLASVRVEEMKASAALFSAKLIQWDLGDDGKYEPYAGDVEAVLALWATAAGGIEALVAQTVALIEAEAPDVIYTMDPRHGSYCHPTHRAAGALMVLALNQLGAKAPEARLLQGTWTGTGGGPGFTPMAEGDATLRFFDATKWSAAQSGESWSYLLDVFSAHASQFQITSEERRALLETADELKRVYWSPLDGAVAGDPLYADLCAPSTF